MNASFIDIAQETQMALDDLAQRLQQLSRLAQAAAIGNVKGVYDEIMVMLSRFSGAESGSIQLIDDSREHLLFEATLRPEELEKLREIRVSLKDKTKVSSWVATTGKPLLLSDAWEDPKFGQSQEKIAESKGVENRSYICVPLKVRNKVIGVLNILHSDPGKFTDDDKNLATYLASYAALSIDQIRLVTTLGKVAKAVSALDLQTIENEAMSALRMIFAAESGSIQLIDDSREHLLFEATLRPEELEKLREMKIPLKDETKVSSRVATTGKLLLLSDAWEDSEFGPSQEKIAESKGVENRSYICVPLEVFDEINKKNQIMGVLNILHSEPGKFTSDDLEIAKIIASFVSAAIGNKKHVDQLIEDRKRQYNTMHAVQIAQATNHFIHNINNEYGFIRTSLEELEKSRKANDLSEEVLWEVLSDIKDASDTVTDMIKQIKQFDKIRKREKVNVQACIEDAKRHLRLHFNEMNIEVLPESPIYVFATRQLTEVFINLIRNSREAMGHSLERNVFISINSFAPGKFIIVTYTDTGPGISPDLENKLFELGVSTKKGEMGGMGLWSSRNWLYSIGGDIRYNAEYKGGGAQFVLELPRIPDAMNVSEADMMNNKG